MYQKGRNITFTDRSNSCVDMFLKDIRKSQPLTNKQEYDLWLLMRQGNKQARDKFVLANLRYVVTVAKKYLASGTSFEDLIMAGSLGITKAADKFDANRGVRFISFAKWDIESEIQKVAYNHFKHKSATLSLDEPINSDKDDSYSLMNSLASPSNVQPDWHLRYDDSLFALKMRLDTHWQGAGEMLDDYLSMMDKGFTASDFARKYHLNDRQKRCFLDIVHTEGRRLRLVA